MYDWSRYGAVRSSWVIGDGRNFVKTMRALSDRVAEPSDALDRVTGVDDQLGRLTFTDPMAEGSWAGIAERVFDLANGNGAAVEHVSTADYYAAAEGPIAPRPGHSDLDLSKIRAAGFEPRDWEDELAEYVSTL